MSIKTTSRLPIIVNTIGIIFALTLNFLAIALPLNGNSTKELSDKYTNLFVPAPMTFSIWSVIYLVLIGFVFMSLYAFWRNKEDDLIIIDHIGLWFGLSSLCNGLWIIAWHYEQLLLSVIIMLTLLYSLIQIYLLLRERALTRTQSIWIRLPFSIYLGWISVATIANISAYLVSMNGTDHSVLWTKIVMGVAIFLAVTMMYQKDLGFGMVIMWALFGIHSRHFASPNTDEMAVARFAQTGLIFLGIYLLIMLVGKKWYVLDEPKN